MFFLSQLFQNETVKTRRSRRTKFRAARYFWPLQVHITVNLLPRSRLSSLPQKRIGQMQGTNVAVHHAYVTNNVCFIAWFPSGFKEMFGKFANKRNAN